LIYHDIRNENPQKTLTAVTGDCPYVLIEGFNSEIRAIALVHSGWRGTSLNIAGKTINTMLNTGIRSGDLKIGILSGICQSCYEVDIHVFEAFPKKIRKLFFKSTRPNHWLMDLKGIIKSQITDTGCNPKSIETIDVCPHCYVDENGKHLLFSHRRGEIERNLICMKL
jgi:polyphenol oxidase